MNYDELQLEYIGGDSMDKIAIVKKEVQLQNWSEREFARQNSGLTIAEWGICETKLRTHNSRMVSERKHQPKYILLPVAKNKRKFVRADTGSGYKNSREYTSKQP